MKTINAVVAVTSFILLTGFSEAKREVLVADCVKQGGERQACACTFDVFGKRLGDQYLEIILLQVSGKTTDYEVAVQKLATENPQWEDGVTSAGEEANRQCAK